MTDAQGEVVWSLEAKAWGRTTQEQGEHLKQNIRFQGQYPDRDSGLHDNTFRDDDPHIGRFTIPTPSGLREDSISINMRLIHSCGLTRGGWNKQAYPLPAKIVYEDASIKVWHNYVSPHSLPHTENASGAGATETGTDPRED